MSLFSLDTPSETCVFCLNKGGSHEHVWPDWLRRHLIARVPDISDDRRRDLDEQANITTTRVCDTCNRNWMRKLEEQVSPALKVMTIGGRREISERDVFFLRRWAIKTAAVFEAFDGDLHTSAQLRTTLRNGSSPADVAVVLGQYIGDTVLMHARSIYKDPKQNDQTLTWVTLVLGRVVLFVFNEYTRHSSVTLTPEARTHFVQLPRGDQRSLSWPVGEAIDQERLELLRHGPNPEMR